MPTLTETVTVPAEPDEVCEFFRHPQAVLDASDPSVGAAIVSAPERLSAGDRVELKLVAFGMPQSVTNEIVEADFPHRFVESQVDGPLGSYRHEHRFEAADGGTRVTDEITFEKPGGLAGLLMTDEKLEEQLADSIAYRNRRLADAVAAFAAGR